MSPIENVQHQSRSGRRSFDVVLMSFVLSVAAVIALGAGGVL